MQVGEQIGRVVRNNRADRGIGFADDGASCRIGQVRGGLIGVTDDADIEMFGALGGTCQ
jgi:hypothetical protein